MARHTEPVLDWASDFDILDPGYVSDPFPIWEELRRRCPVAHTSRRASTWMPTRYEDVVRIAHDPGRFSSAAVGVIPPVGEGTGEPPEPGEVLLAYGLPPITADPPLHTWTRRLLLPWFSHRRVEGYAATTRSIASRLVESFADRGAADAAADYAQQIPARVIGLVLGVPEALSDTFTGWVRDFLEFADDDERRAAGGLAMFRYLSGELERRREEPGEDLLTDLLGARVHEGPVDDAVILGMAMLVLVAGVDTTWSAIGASLWHLATHDDDRHRLVAEPELLPIAVEELLRAYAPVTMGRLVTEDTEVGGCPMAAGERVLLNFAAANRDPEAFPEADRVVLDRAHNRHVAFGSGIHRCAGSNLARMELAVALEEWLRRIPEFHLAPGAEVRWAGGQVRGPRTVPVRFPPSGAQG